MFNFKCKQKDVEVKSNTEEELERLVAVIERKDAEIKALKDLMSNTITASTFVFDFDAVKVFSVERMLRDGAPCTIIGYMNKEESIVDGNKVTNEKVKEWYYYCNQDQHENIVKEFRAHMK